MNSGLKSPHRLIAASFLLLAFSVSFAADEPTEPDQKTAATLSFGGVDYLHRWSKNGQNEFTPKGQEDLAKWQDMITINVHEGVVNGDQLADLANRVLGNYQARARYCGRIQSLERRSARRSIWRWRFSAHRLSWKPSLHGLS
jgi:hypothetical protein